MDSLDVVSCIFTHRLIQLLKREDAGSWYKPNITAWYELLCPHTCIANERFNNKLKYHSFSQIFLQGDWEWSRAGDKKHALTSGKKPELFWILSTFSISVLQSHGTNGMNSAVCARLLKLRPAHSEIQVWSVLELNGDLQIWLTMITYSLYNRIFIFPKGSVLQ